MQIKKRAGHLLLWLVVSLAIVGSAFAVDSQELWQFRNLGKAFYENPTTQFQAVEMFQKALELAPGSPRERVNYGLSLIRAGKAAEGVAELVAVQAAAPEIPHTWFNLGIAYKKEARYPEAVKQFERMVELVPDEPISHYNLGVVLKLTGEMERSLHHFEKAAELAPWMAGPYFQMYNSYRAMGRADDAKEALATFQENKRRQSGAAVQEDLDWSYYAEIYDDIYPVAAPAIGADQFRSALRFESKSLGQAPGSGGGILTTDLDGSGGVDLVHWSESGIFSRALRDQASEWRQLSPLPARNLAPADLDNDGKMDFAVVTSDRVALLYNRGAEFEAVELSASGNFHQAVWMDFDHDSDLDLFLFGPESRLMRNEGNSGFADATERFPFVPGEAVSGAFLDLIKDTNGSELLVAYRDRPAVLYRDRLAGNFRAEDLEALPGGDWVLTAGDLDNDGWTDVLAAGSSGVRPVFNREGKLEVGAALPGVASAVAVDLLNRGFVDLIPGNQVLKGLGKGQWSAAASLDLPADVSSLAVADYNLDGKLDVAALTPSGEVLRLTNASASSGNWISVQLTGVRNAKLAPGSEIEVKAGPLYQKKLYDGTPAHFGLGSQATVDTVRITWPNGLIQNEPEQPVGAAVAYEEKQRLSGSCPMVFTWNGSEFEFITDVLAVAPLGAAAGDGVFFQVNNDEYIQIDGRSLVADHEGYLDIRVTEELREIGYIDQVKLIAVDRPEDMFVATSDKFVGPPYPEFRLYGARERHAPVKALDHRGQDVLAKVLKRDRTYPDQFERDFLGVAELHSLELDFGSVAGDNRAILVLHGWVDWADGSTIRKLAQDSTTRLVMPYLQVKDGAGNWVTVVEDMGVPAGKPKTIVVDLTDRFLSDSREVRIVTNLCLYWDEIFLSPDVEAPALTLTEVALADADLRWRGFATPVVSPDRKQPEEFDYSRWMPVSMWNPAEGMYTRYGPVDELLSGIDDLMVIMGSGDELRLRFRASDLPEVPAGHRRDYLLYVNGWAKDGDFNTAFSQTVEPLPFQGMSSYPYPEGEGYPDTPVHQQYRETYNTRPALRLIRSLADGVGGPAGAGMRRE